MQHQHNHPTEDQAYTQFTAQQDAIDELAQQLITESDDALLDLFGDLPDELKAQLLRQALKARNPVADMVNVALLHEAKKIAESDIRKDKDTYEVRGLKYSEAA